MMEILLYSSIQSSQANITWQYNEFIYLITWEMYSLKSREGFAALEIYLLKILCVVVVKAPWSFKDALSIIQKCH